MTRLTPFFSLLCQAILRSDSCSFCVFLSGTSLMIFLVYKRLPFPCLVSSQASTRVIYERCSLNAFYLFFFLFHTAVSLKRTYAYFNVEIVLNLCVSTLFSFILCIGFIVTSLVQFFFILIA